MFHRKRVAKQRREYELQPAADFLFTKPPAAVSAPGTMAWLVSGPSMPYRLTRLDELHLSLSDVPALTVTADPTNLITVAGGERSDWSLRFSVLGEGESEEQARQRLDAISMVRMGGTVSLIAPPLLQPEQTSRGSSNLVVEAPQDASMVIHSSYAAVQIRDMKGPVRITASHARATVLDAIGQVDVTAFVIDFSGDRGQVTLSAEAEINMRLYGPQFEGTLLASAQRSVRVLVPHGFMTPFCAVVGRRQDFVCRTEFASHVRHEKKGTLHYFTYSGADPVGTDTENVSLRSEQATVVIDTIEDKNPKAPH